MSTQKTSKNYKKEDGLENFYGTLSNAGRELFSDFLSEISRSRQLYTLISAVISVLLAYALVDPSATIFDGTVISFSDLTIPKKLAGAICIYFMIVYLVSVIMDYQVYRYQSLSAIGAMGKTRGTILANFNRNRKAKMGLSYSVRVSNSKQRSTFQSMKKAAEEKIIHKYLPKIKSLQDEIGMMRNSAIQTPENNAKIKDLTNSIEKIVIKRDKELSELTREISPLIEHEKDHQTENHEKPLEDIKYQLDTLRNIQNSYQFFNWLILVVEVFFPIALGCFAVWAVFIKT